ncbi:hypothetical protein FOL47_009119 [Perkinsus chesapeaki]|uniref:Uncharacterized protein n=1 Tax=Perkinsus chesapeaki TaxID=330153 RepID=A0A7J6LAC8_PERCH|nr:hypothetical protein FOL47_009119 [Perkinsus chesapeaki]
MKNEYDRLVKREYLLELNNIGKWVNDMMKSYEKRSGKRNYTDDAIKSQDSSKLQISGWNEFIAADDAKKRVENEFPIFLKKLYKMASESDSLFNIMRDSLVKLQKLVLPRSSTGLMRLRRKLGEEILKQQGRVSNAFVDMFKTLEKTESEGRNDLRRSTNDIHALITRELGSFLTDITRNAASLARLCYSTDKDFRKAMDNVKKASEGHKKILLKAERRVNKEMAKEDELTDKDEIEFEKASGANKAALERTRGNIRNRAEASSNALTLWKEEYVGRGEIKLNTTFPRAISKSEKDINNEKKDLDYKLKSDEKLYERSARRLGGEFNRDLKKTKKQAITVKLNADMDIKDLLKEFFRVLKMEDGRGSKFYRELQEHLRKSSEVVNGIGENANNEKDNYLEEIGRLKSMLETAANSEASKIETSDKTVGQLYSQETNLLANSLADTVNRNREDATRTSKTFEEWLASLGLNSERDMSNVGDEVSQTEEDINIAVKDIDNNIKTRVGKDDKALAILMRILEAGMNDGELNAISRENENRARLNNIINNLRREAGADDKTNEADMNKYDNDVKDRYDEILSAESSVYSTGDDNEKDIERVLSSSREGVSDIINELKAASSEYKSSEIPIKTKENSLKIAVRNIDDVSNDNIKGLDESDKIDNAKAKADINKLIQALKYNITGSMGGKVAILANQFGVSERRMKEIIESLKRAEKEQTTTLGEIKGDLNGIESNSKNEKVNTQKELANILSSAKRETDEEIHKTELNNNNEITKAERLMLDMVNDNSGISAVGAREEGRSVYKALDFISKGEDKLRRLNMEEDAAVNMADELYKDKLPERDRGIKALERELNLENIKRESDKESVLHELLRRAKDRAKEVNITMLNLNKSIDHIESILQGSQDSIFKTAIKSSDITEAFIEKLREVMLKDKEAVLETQRRSISDLEHKYNLLVSATEEESSLVNNEINTYNISVNERTNMLDNTLSKVTQDAERVGKTDEEMNNYIDDELINEAKDSENEFNKIHKTVKDDSQIFKDKLSVMNDNINDKLNKDEDRLKEANMKDTEKISDYLNDIEGQATRGGNVIGYNKAAVDGFNKELNDESVISDNELTAMMHVAMANAFKIEDYISLNKNSSLNQTARVDDALNIFTRLISAYLQEEALERKDVKDRLDLLQADYEERIAEHIKSFAEPTGGANKILRKYEERERENVLMQKALKAHAMALLRNVRDNDLTGIKRGIDILSDNIESTAKTIDKARSKSLSILQRHIGDSIEDFSKRLLRITLDNKEE